MPCTGLRNSSSASSSRPSTCPPPGWLKWSSSSSSCASSRPTRPVLFTGQSIPSSGEAWLSTLSIFVSLFFQCIAQDRSWNRHSVQGYCINFHAGLLVTGSFNALSDLLILILPLWATWHLHTGMKRKAGVMAVFGTGLLYEPVLWNPPPEAAFKFDQKPWLNPSRFPTQRFRLQHLPRRLHPPSPLQHRRHLHQRANHHVDVRPPPPRPVN